MPIKKNGKPKQNEIIHSYQEFMDRHTTPELKKIIFKHPNTEEDSSECLHRSCPECHGTGKKANGGMCVHMISCPCPRCTPYCLGDL